MQRILGLGNDLHHMQRFRAILQSKNEYKITRFSQRVLHPKHELPIFEKSLNGDQRERCAEILSTSWCVKEAIYKTLTDEEQARFRMNQWYKVNSENGRPVIGNDCQVSGNFMVSISHDMDLVNAVVLRQ